MSTITVSNSAKRKASWAKRERAVKRTKTVRVPRNMSLGPFPLKQIRNLTYCDTVIIQSAIGDEVGTYIWSANSIADPDVSGTGHQPYGHDTLATMYTNYSVKSSVIDITFTEQVSETSFQPKACGVYNNDLSTALTDGALVREQPRCVWKVLANDDSVMVRGMYKRDSRFPAYSQNNTGAVFGNSPLDGTRFDVFTARRVTTTAAQVIAFVKITYEVEMWDPRKLPLS